MKRKLLILLMIIGMVMWILPLSLLSAEPPADCPNEGGAGNVSLKAEHAGQSWEIFEHEDCGDIEAGQYLWHLVLSPVNADASATIDGVAGINNGGSIHWTIINNSPVALNWVAIVTSGLQYNPAQDCSLKSELRVSHTCGGDTTTTTTTEGTTTTTEGTTTTTESTTTTTTESTTTESTTTETTTTESTTTETTTTETTTTIPNTTTTVPTDTTEKITETTAAVANIKNLPMTGLDKAYYISGILITVLGIIGLAVLCNKLKKRIQ